MRTPRTSSWFGLSVFALLIAMFGTPTRSFADTYQILNLQSDQGYFFYGMNEYGDAVIDLSSYGGCPISAGHCYETYVDGLPTGMTSTPPTLIYDNGGQCAPTLPAGESSLYAACNSGRVAWTGYLKPTQVMPSIYTGPSSNPSAVNLVPGANGDNTFIFINSQGDVVWDDVFDEEFFEAIDLTAAVPEPTSLLLFGTGILALAAFSARLRARRVRPSTEPPHNSPS